ncbi:MAG: hypothetical protein KDK89_04720 [Alphaproteobacteria bacterium]|nr:hypothetical protein [Alphaproteobacteria bacterium]
MRALTIALALVMSLVVAGRAVAEPAPAGYVVAVALQGEDSHHVANVVREGAERSAKLMMPLYAGDVVFVRDPASRIDIELGGGERVTLGGNVMRHDVAGEIDTEDDTWSIIAAIGGILGGDKEQTAPDNMVAKGDEATLAIPMGRRSGNLVLSDQRLLWLGWTGGEAPFTLRVSGVGSVIESTERQASVALPAVTGDGFSIELADSRGYRTSIRFRTVEALPEVPPNVTGQHVPDLRDLAAAAWLSGQDDGAWVIAAAQVLSVRPTPAGLALREALRQGWRLQ